MELFLHTKYRETLKYNISKIPLFTQAVADNIVCREIFCVKLKKNAAYRRIFTSGLRLLNPVVIHIHTALMHTFHPYPDLFLPFLF